MYVKVFLTQNILENELKTKYFCWLLEGKLENLQIKTK